MSSNQSYSYSSFSSTSYSSSSDSSGNRYEEHTSSDPSGTTIYRTTQQSGQPAVSETTRYPTSGSRSQTLQGVSDEKRIEDVTDKDEEADRLYEEKIEEEYAKREGGA